MIRKYTIFVVDNDRFNLLAISRKLKDSFNCNTHLFTDPKECLKMLKTNSPDLILTELQLKGKSGTSVFYNGRSLQKSIHKINTNIPVLLYSRMFNLTKDIQTSLKNNENFIPKDEKFLKSVIKKVKKHLIQIHDHNKNKRLVYFGIATLAAALIVYITIRFYDEYTFLYLLTLAAWSLALFNYILEPLHNKKPVFKAN